MCFITHVHSLITCGGLQQKMMNSAIAVLQLIVKQQWNYKRPTHNLSARVTQTASSLLLTPPRVTINSSSYPAFRKRRNSMSSAVDKLPSGDVCRWLGMAVCKTQDFRSNAKSSSNRDNRTSSNVCRYRDEPATASAWASRSAAKSGVFLMTSSTRLLTRASRAICFNVVARSWFVILNASQPFHNSNFCIVYSARVSMACIFVSVDPSPCLAFSDLPKSQRPLSF